MQRSRQLENDSNELSIYRSRCVVDTSLFFFLPHNTVFPQISSNFLANVQLPVGILVFYTFRQAISLVVPLERMIMVLMQFPCLWLNAQGRTISAISDSCPNKSWAISLEEVTW